MKPYYTQLRVYNTTRDKLKDYSPLDSYDTIINKLLEKMKQINVYDNRNKYREDSLK